MGEATDSPVLHYWSLSMEEQFYLIWPLILYFSRTWNVRLRFMSYAAIALASLTYAMYCSGSFEIYYLLPARGFEMMLGGMVAFVEVESEGEKKIFSGGIGSVVGLSGLAVIGGSFFYVNNPTTYPGLMALVPCLATAAVIAAGSPKWSDGGGMLSANAILSVKPMMWLGWISYSVYLVHWPVICLSRYLSLESLEQRIAPVVTLIVATVVSFKCFEQPFRRIDWPFWKVALVLFVVPALIVAGTATASSAMVDPGIKDSDIAPKSDIALRFISPEAARQWPRDPEILRKERIEEKGLLGRSKGKKDTGVVLMGDSHAAHFTPLLHVLGEKFGFNFRLYHYSTTPPFPYHVDEVVKHFTVPSNPKNGEFLNDLRDNVVPKAKVVILAGLWTFYQKRIDLLEKTLEKLKDKSLVIVLGQVPLFMSFPMSQGEKGCPRKALAVLRKNQAFKHCFQSRKYREGDEVNVNRRIQKIVEKFSNARYFDSSPYVCPVGICSPYSQEGYRMYFERSHLSFGGSLYLGTTIAERCGLPEVFDPLLALKEIQKK